MEYLPQVIVNGLAVGGLYALIALSIVILTKAAGMLNFAQGNILVLAGYIGVTLSWNFGMDFYATLIVVTVLLAVLGAALELLFIRPMVEEPPLVQVMSTIGFSSIIFGFVWLGWDLRKLPVLFNLPPLGFTIQGVGVATPFVWAFIISLLITALVTALFKFSKVGIAMRAAAENKTVAMSLGISAQRMVFYAFILSTAIAGPSALILAKLGGAADPNMVTYMFHGFVVAIVGGLTSIPGAILAGFALGIIQSMAIFYLNPQMPGVISDIVPYVILVLMLLVRPYGFFGEHEIERL